MPTLADRLQGRISGDTVLAGWLDKSPLRIGLRALSPSGVDLIGCALSRSVFSSRTACVALALPRGEHSLPALIGAYLTAWRHRADVPGSVAVSTRRPSLRERVAALRIPIPGWPGHVKIARLGSLPVSGGKIRAAAVSLNSRGRTGLSQSDGCLLFQLPNVAPPLAENVVTTAVIDTIGSSRAIWERSYDRNRSARRRQVWIGELGDPAFDHFCSERDIPLFRFNWQVIASATASFGTGSPPLTTSRLCEREPPAPAYRVCHHGEFDEEFENLVTRLYEMQRIGRNEAETPACVRQAFALAFLLGRLACPVSTYDRHAAFAPFVRTTADLMRVIEGARDGDFRDRWKRSLGHWPSVKGSCRRLLELAEEECPKWWAMIERVDAARAAGERLRIVCQTKVERAALTESLIASGEISVEELGTFVEVATAAQRVEYGDSDEMPTRIFLAPAPPWLAGVYLSGEPGGSEFLCYPGQARQLSRAFNRTWSVQTQPAYDHAVLDALGIYTGDVVEAALPPPPVIELDAFSFDGAAPPVSVDERDRVREFWEQAVELYGKEIELGDEGSTATGAQIVPARGNVLARRVSFAEGPAVYFPDDGECDVLRRLGTTGATRVDSVPLRELRTGMHVAVLPGAERGTILDELLGAWDAQLGSAKDLYENLWRRALDRTIEIVGPAELARVCGVTEGAVALWVRGETKPQQRAGLLKIIDLSGEQLVRDNAGPIVHYIRHTRGVHRIIGRALNEAVGETVVTGDRRSVRSLERLVGRELDDLFAAVQVLTVSDVSAAQSVPAVLLGRFLDPDEADLKGAA